MVRSVYEVVKRRLDARRKYRQMINEIASLTQEELIDMGAFQVDLYRAVRKESYG